MIAETSLAKKLLKSNEYIKVSDLAKQLIAFSNEFGESNLTMENIFLNIFMVDSYEFEFQKIENLRK
jgi:hypothetical protein